MEILKEENGIIYEGNSQSGKISYEELIEYFFKDRIPKTHKEEELLVTEISVVSSDIKSDDKILTHVVAKYFNINEDEIEIL